MQNAANSRSSRRGRPSIDVNAREIITLITLLRPGVSYSIDNVAKTLNIPRAEASRLLRNLLGVSDGWNMCVPLAVTPDGQELQLNGNISYGRQINLLPIHKMALASALNIAGMPQDDPLRQKLSEDVPVANTQAPNSLDTGELGLLRTCMLATYYGWPLQFEYLGTNDTAPRLRTVQPKRLLPNTLSGMWFLRGFDLDKYADRSFNLTRMKHVQVLSEDPEDSETPTRPTALITTPSTPEQRTSPEQTEHAEAEQAKPAEPQQAESQQVELVFSNRYVADLFSWNESSREELADGRIKLTVSYYRGMWLPRRIAACLPEVQCNNQHVLNLAYEWLETLKTQTMLLQHDPYVPLDKPAGQVTS